MDVVEPGAKAHLVGVAWGSVLVEGDVRIQQHPAMLHDSFACHPDEGRSPNIHEPRPIGL